MTALISGKHGYSLSTTHDPSSLTVRKLTYFTSICWDCCHAKNGAQSFPWPTLTILFLTRTQNLEYLAELNTFDVFATISEDSIIESVEIWLSSQPMQISATAFVALMSFDRVIWTSFDARTWNFSSPLNDVKMWPLVLLVLNSDDTKGLIYVDNCLDWLV